MKTIKVKTLDYYNIPSYYPFMPREIFNALELSFLKDEEFTEVPEDAFEKMVEDFKTMEQK